MATFRYTGVTSGGATADGIVKAVDRTAATLEIRQSVEVITSLKEIDETPDILAGFTKPKVDIKQLSLVCRQFSIILHAGLPITTSIRLVGNQTKDKTLKDLLTDVGEDVLAGASVADSFEARNPYLPTTFIETIRAGEASGKLDVAFERLATYFTKRSQSQGKVKSALIYPVIVLVVAVVVVAILMVFAVPKFTETFADLGTELPGVTKALIAVSDFFVNYIWFLLLFVALLFLLFKFYANTDAGRYNIDEFRLKIPVLGKIRLMSSASEFATSFATMLASGIPAVKALNITGRAVSNFSISQDILTACTRVESGYKIGDSLRETTALPSLLVEVVGVGESSGSMEHTLSVISEFYDNEVDEATKNALAILEPAMILGLAVIVIFILLAVYLPMFSMYGSM